MLHRRGLQESAARFLCDKINFVKTISIFTDGSSRGNPGPGGFGAIIIFSEEKNNNGAVQIDAVRKSDTVAELGGIEKHTTNNRMEITAAIAALSYLSKIYNLKSPVSIYSDSSYLVNGITKWVHGWEKNGWKTMARQPVENQDLWETLVELTRNYAEHSRNKIQWELVKGHIGIAGNNRADEIATAFADNLKPELYNGPLEKYPIKNILDIKIDGEKNSKKSDDKNRSRAKAYSYISLVDGIIKVHKTWGECEARVRGVPGAKYKKALLPEEEKEIIKNFAKKCPSQGRE